MTIQELDYTETHEGSTYAALKQLWDGLTTPVHDVLAVSPHELLVEGAQVRFVTQETWLYRDAAENYELLRTADLDTWVFDAKENHGPSEA